MHKIFLFTIILFTFSIQIANASWLSDFFDKYFGSPSGTTNNSQNHRTVPKTKEQQPTTQVFDRMQFTHSPNTFNAISDILSDITKQNDEPTNNNFDTNINNVEIIKGAQEYLGVDTDGIIGRKTIQAIKEFQENNNLEQTGKLDENTLTKLDEEIDNSERNDPKIDLGGSGKGDSIGQMRGTNFCTTKNGGKDRDGVISCGVYTGDCNNLGKNPNKETVEACAKCENCRFIKGSCGTPLYFYKGSTSNAQTEANKEIRAVALTQSKLKEVFGSSSQSAYCGKSINVCYGSPDNCKQFPVRDTGHARADTIDMTGAVFNDLGISDDINPVNMNKLFVFRIDLQPKSQTQVAELKK